MQRETPQGVSLLCIRHSGSAWPDRRTYRRPCAAPRSRSGRTCGCRPHSRPAGAAWPLSRHLQMAVEKFAPFFFLPAGVDAGKKRADGVGVCVPAPSGAVGLGGLAVFQVGHERTADLQMLREQVAGLSGRARGIFGASFAQQRQKGMQFCARCAIIDAIMQ